MIHIRLFPLYLLLISINMHGQRQKEADYYAALTPLNFRSDDKFNEVIDVRDPDIDRICAVLFFLTNEIRLKNKHMFLPHAWKLEHTAQMHAEDMVRDDFFSHVNPRDENKKTPNDRAGLHHISNPYLAENIIEGYALQYTSKKKVYFRGRGFFSYEPDGELIKVHTYLSLGENLLTRWMNSREHRKNILAREAVQLGCGICFYYNAGFNEMPSCKAVQNFQWYHAIQ